MATTPIPKNSLENKFFKTANEAVNAMAEMGVHAYAVYSLFKKMSNENDNGDSVWPSYSYIEEITGLSRMSVYRAINRLVKFGWISEIDKGFNSVNTYHINNTRKINFSLVAKRNAKHFSKDK